MDKDTKKGIIIVVFVAIVCAYFVGQSSKNFTTFADQITSKGNNIYSFQNGSFSAYFPSQPIFATSTMDLTEKNSILDNNYYSAYPVGADGNTYAELEVNYISSAFNNSKTPEENLKNEVAYTNGPTGPHPLISSSATTYQGLPAINYTSYDKTTEYYAKGIDILKGNDLYMIEYFYKSGEEDKTLENTFLNSISFSNTDNATGSSQEATTTNNTAPVSQTPPVADNSNQGSSQPTTQNTTDLASIVSEWQTRVAHIVCLNSTDPNATASMGSGMITSMDLSSSNYTGPTVITNAHVVLDQSNPGHLYLYCGFKLPDNPNFYSTDPLKFVYSTTDDIEYIPVSTTLFPNNNLQYVTAPKVCRGTANIGDSVVILGYPVNGGTGGSITATRGIILSYDGKYYVTDAKIDHGNSGGVAILLKDDCYLGIPTWVSSGGFESLGRILSASYVLSN